MSGTIFPIRWSWQRLFSYGEVICFVSAWAIGLLLAIEGQAPEHEPSTARSFAATSDALGIQATLRR
jgi:hypothetical protein